MYAKPNMRMAASSNSNVNVSTGNTDVRITGRRHSGLVYLWCVMLHCASEMSLF